MGKIIDRIQNLNVDPEEYVYLNYEDSTEVWHISDSYIEEALTEISTPNMLATLLATPGITVYSRYEEDILATMREEGLLDNYERDHAFEEYLTETIRTEAYQYDLLTISTERHDHKRGTCEIAVNVKVKAGDLYGLGVAADALIAGFEIVLQTPHGLLTLDT